jgi:hypothetical protein
VDGFDVGGGGARGRGAEGGGGADGGPGAGGAAAAGAGWKPYVWMSMPSNPMSFNVVSLPVERSKRPLGLMGMTGRA